MAKEANNTWQEFVARTRPADEPQDDAFSRMAHVLRGSPRLGLSWLRQATNSPWYGPTGLFIAAALFASLPPPDTFAAWIGGADVWRLMQASYAVRGLGLASVATFAVQFFFSVRQRSAPRPLIDAQSLLASATLFVAGVLWLIVIVFAALGAIVDIVVTLFWLFLILWILFAVGRAAIRSGL